MEQADHILTRDNRNAHITVSAWIMDRDRKKVLMAYHNLYQSWAWLGGHADGDADLKAVALKEIREESGLESVRFVTEDIFSLEILTVDGHEKRGSYVPSHLHLNVTYLLEADPELPLRIKEDENSEIGWIGVEEIQEDPRKMVCGTDLFQIVQEGPEPEEWKLAFWNERLRGNA
ncbi:MAG: NUDIX hydrolase [Enterocloster sp.]